jgi:hypothetical protein
VSTSECEQVCDRCSERWPCSCAWGRDRDDDSRPVLRAQAIVDAFPGSTIEDESDE